MQSLTGPVLLSHPSLSEPSVKLLALDTMNVDLILRVEIVTYSYQHEDQWQGSPENGLCF